MEKLLVKNVKRFFLFMYILLFIKSIIFVNQKRTSLKFHISQYFTR